MACGRHYTMVVTVDGELWAFGVDAVWDVVMGVSKRVRTGGGGYAG